MKKYDWVIGVDPDAERHALAFYQAGTLVELCTLTLPDIVNSLIYQGATDRTSFFSIEHVAAQSFVYNRNKKSTKKLESRVAVSVGRNQQSQIELVRWLDRYGIPYALHKPTGRNWANSKYLFERQTGWKKQSNQDTRSAAFFGFIEKDRCV